MEEYRVFPTRVGMYLMEHADELGEPDAFLGGWVDENGFACLDISFNITSLHEAMVVAREADQDAVWGVVNSVEINVKKYWEDWYARQKGK